LSTNPRRRLLDRCILSSSSSNGLLPALHHSTLCLHVFTRALAAATFAITSPPED
jgi:hypothetical protein